MIGGYLRWLGIMLFTLLLGLFQVDGFGAVSAAKESQDRCFIACSVRYNATASVNGTSGHATQRVCPHALPQNTHTGVFHRLKPRIVMIPRMNRTPKPKSVYRCFARAPGELSF